MKTYAVSKHAIERGVERFGWEKAQVRNEVSQRMQTAYYQGDTPDGKGGFVRVFDHHKSRVRMLVGDNDKVITIYPMEDSPIVLAESQALPSELSEAIRKKATTLSRKYTKELRQVVRQLAVTNVAIAEKELAKLRVNNPKTKAFIDAKLTELTDMRDGFAASQSELTEQLAELKKHQ